MIDIRISRLGLWCGDSAYDLDLEERLDMVKPPWRIAEGNPEPIIRQGAVDSLRHREHGIILSACDGVGGAFVDDQMVLLLQLELRCVRNEVFRPQVPKSISLELFASLQSKRLIVDVRDVLEAALTEVVM